jgi:D-alanyl-D-alanine carboxypeptidase (penicillin-binding protein 5/6)
MTALLLYESNSLNQQVTTKLPEDYEFAGKVAYLDKGLILSTEELLELILVYSANDAAYVAAMDISDSIEDFVNLMNLKAKEIGMNDTVYLNPDGLDELGHHTTLNDLLILSVYIIENTKILDITSKEKIYINALNKKTFTNTNAIINEGFEGLKTGWTSEAGLTFVGFNQNNNRRVITIVNNSLVDKEKINHFIDTKVLYENSVNDFNIKNVLNKNDIIYEIFNSQSVTSYYPNKNLTSFIKSDTNIQKNVKIQNNKFLISFNNIPLQESINIPSSKFNISYQFHWSNRFLNNIFNN